MYFFYKFINVGERICPFRSFSLGSHCSEESEDIDAVGAQNRITYRGDVE